MNETPRLRSAYPATPNTSRTAKNDQSTRSGGHASKPSVTKPLPKATPDDDELPPVIPLHLIDAPSQRLYVCTFYIGLTAWRLYDHYTLVAEETESLWMFMKWMFIDATFLYGVPELRIPWLQWSTSWIMVAYLVHAALDAVLMFRIPVGSKNSSVNTC
jgi:nucleoporin POM152